jgi:hypothetical protein
VNKPSKRTPEHDEEEIAICLLGEIHSILPAYIRPGDTKRLDLMTSVLADVLLGLVALQENVHPSRVGRVRPAVSSAGVAAMRQALHANLDTN